MNTLELFSGTASFSKAAKEFGHETMTIDNDPSFCPDICIDALEIDIDRLYEIFDIVWASPPCTAFSVASIGKHWTGGFRAYTPKTDTAVMGLKLLDKTISIISYLKPKYWFIENPRGMMRKVIDEIFKKYDITGYRRVTVTYCRYGDRRMKPTDIWTNSKTWISRPVCHNGDPCHTPAPRGSKTGTQGLKGAKERAVIPRDLMLEILRSCR